MKDQIDELENAISSNTKNQPSKNDSTSMKNVKELEKEIEKLEAVDIEHEIIQKLQKQNKKLYAIKKKLQSPPETSKKSKKTVKSKNVPEAYCVKCKTKRQINDPEEIIMKNGSPISSQVLSQLELTFFNNSASDSRAFWQASCFFCWFFLYCSLFLCCHEFIEKRQC